MCPDPLSCPVLAGSWWEHPSPGAGLCQGLRQPVCEAVLEWDHLHTDGRATASQRLYGPEQDKTLPTITGSPRKMSLPFNTNREREEVVRVLRV